MALALTGWRDDTGIAVKQMAGDLGYRDSTVYGWFAGASFPDRNGLELITGYTGLTPCRLVCVYAAQCMPARCAFLPPRPPPPTGPH